MRVLLTGSSGRLGQALAEALGRAGHAVIGLDPRPGPATQVVGSVADRDLLARTFAGERFDGVVHASGLHQPDVARRSAAAFVEANVAGTAALLEEAAAAGVGRLVYSSTTSLMVDAALHEGRLRAAAWLDEAAGPLAPRNAYGVTKLAAEGLCRLWAREPGRGCVVLRLARFFAGCDGLPPERARNVAANELLHRRLTLADAVRAHLLALERAPAIGFATLIVSAPPPFARADCAALATDAAAVIAARFPDARALYAARGWQLPARIDRVYDPARAEAVLGFRCRTDFAAVLAALRSGAALPFEEEPEAGAGRAFAVARS